MKQRRKSQGGRPSVESRTEATAEEINPAAIVPSLPPSTVEFLQVICKEISIIYVDDN